MLLQKGLAFRRDWSGTDSTDGGASSWRSKFRPAHARASGSAAINRRLNRRHPCKVNQDRVAATHQIIRFNPNDRRHFIGGSDARIIMGDDQDDLVRLWREKRGELPPPDFSQNLDRSTRLGDGGVEPSLVRALHRSARQGHPEARSPSHQQMDGGDT